MLSDVFERLKEIREEDFLPVGTGKLIGASVAILLLFLLEGTSRDGWVPILDSLNLVFHEAGHPVFGIFGHTIGFLGGTIMQLLVPLAVAGSCWGKRQSVAMGIAGVWFFQNFLNISRYMADARAQLLPLAGGGEHDWGTLFGEWNVLSYDTSIAAVFKILGWTGMVGCTLWIVWRWLQTQRAAK